MANKNISPPFDSKIRAVIKKAVKEISDFSRAKANYSFGLRQQPGKARFFRSEVNRLLSQIPSFESPDSPRYAEFWDNLQAIVGKTIETQRIGQVVGWKRQVLKRLKVMREECESVADKTRAELSSALEQ